MKREPESPEADPHPDESAAGTARDRLPADRDSVRKLKEEIRLLREELQSLYSSPAWRLVSFTGGGCGARRSTGRVSTACMPPWRTGSPSGSPMHRPPPARTARPRRSIMNGFRRPNPPQPNSNCSGSFRGNSRTSP